MLTGTAVAGLWSPVAVSGRAVRIGGWKAKILVAGAESEVVSTIAIARSRTVTAISRPVGVAATKLVHVRGRRPAWRGPASAAAMVARVARVAVARAIGRHGCCEHDL